MNRGQNKTRQATPREAGNLPQRKVLQDKMVEKRPFAPLGLLKGSSC